MRGESILFQGLLLKYPNVILEDRHRIPNKSLSGTILAQISFPIMVLKPLIRCRIFRLAFYAFLHTPMHIINIPMSTLCSIVLMEYISSYDQIWRLENKDKTSILAKLECLLFDSMLWDFLPPGVYGSLPLLLSTLTSACQNPAHLARHNSKVLLSVKPRLISQSDVNIPSLEAPKNPGHLFWLICVCVCVCCITTIFRLKIPKGRTCVFLISLYPLQKLPLYLAHSS